MDTLACGVKGFVGFRAGIRASGHDIETQLIGGTGLDTDTLEVSWVVASGVIRPLIWVIGVVTLLIYGL